MGTPSHGTASILAGKVHYVPAADYVGSDSLIYTVTDGAAQASGTVTFTVTDSVAPTINITDPVSTSSYTSASATLTSLAGIASDNVGVTAVTWSNSLGGNGTANGTTNWSIPGIALQAGATPNLITVTAFDAASNSVSATISVTYNIQTGLQSWRQLQGLAGDGSQDLATPAGDNVSNLMKYALNMAPNAGNLALPAYSMAAGGTSGLPYMGVDGAGNLTYAFVRRNAGSNSGITYSVEQSNDLATWETCVTVPSVTAIDFVWERVSYVIDTASAPRMFLRLKVTSP